jgi:hypothetical protein
LSLPLLFETDLASIPSCSTGLKTNADRVAKFHKTLSLGKDRLNIGLACSGNSEHKNDRNRTMPLHHIAPLLPLANVFLIQKEVRASDLEFLGDHPEIHFMGAELYDFEDTAAVVQNMDLIISVDTSLAHLAGSRGKKLFAVNCLNRCRQFSVLVARKNKWLNDTNRITTNTPNIFFIRFSLWRELRFKYNSVNK